ncbi:MAG: Crp/Fnr family transcriptional regulator [Bacteroidota bacterium]
MEKFRNYLRTISEISNEEFEKSIHYFKEIIIKKDDYFINQNQICKQVAFILKGTLRTFYINREGVNTTMCFCSENSFTTSYRSFILEKPSELSLQALEDCVLLVISKDDLNKLYAESITWQYIGRKIAEGEYIILEKYASVLNSETAKQKYLRLLNEQPGVLQKAKIEDIASYLGITGRTLSRIRKEIASGN